MRCVSSLSDTTRCWFESEIKHAILNFICLYNFEEVEKDRNKFEPVENAILKVVVNYEELKCLNLKVQHWTWRCNLGWLKLIDSYNDGKGTDKS